MAFQLMAGCTAEKLYDRALMVNYSSMKPLNFDWPKEARKHVHNAQFDAMGSEWRENGFDDVSQEITCIDTVRAYHVRVPSSSKAQSRC